MNHRIEPAMSKNVGISGFLLVLMSIASGVAVANLYYCQPLLEELSRFFQVSPTVIGITAMLIQIGYAMGLFFLVPLGDIRERRSLILVMLGCSLLALVGISFAPTIGWLMAGSLLVGLTSIVPQLIVPLAAHMAKPA
ncbi:MAG TPA: MFS transporter, partial [Firmicutes bacterium]|nr:MFS transporter [Bacillota bacterium]